MAKRKNKKTSKIDLDIIIPVFGQPELLNKCIESVEETCKDINYKLILVDDFSPNQEELEEIYKGKTVIKNSQNRGFPFTCNTGAALGSAKNILFLNSDIVLKPNCVQEMLNTVNNDNIPLTPHTPTNNKGVGVVSCKLIFPEDSVSERKPSGKVQHAGLCFSLSHTPKHRLIGWDSKHAKVNVQMELQAVSGACLLIKREVWDLIYKAHRQIGDPSRGGFNEIYGRGTYEDVELCLATRSFGYRVMYESKAEAYHFTNGSAEKEGGFPINKNRAIFSARCGHLLAYDEWLLL